MKNSDTPKPPLDGGSTSNEASRPTAEPASSDHPAPERPAPDLEHPADACEELGSWKEIADFLKVNTRTAQKWERERGMPVRRTPGAKGRVSAHPAALQKWRRANLTSPSWWNSLPFFRTYSVAVTAVAVAAVALSVTQFLASHTRGRPTLFRAEYRTLYVLNERGSELWHTTFAEALAVNMYVGDEGQSRVWFGDVDGDGGVETLFAFHASRVESKESAVYCFSEDGDIKWRFAPAATVSDASRPYLPQYIIGAFAVIEAPFGRGRAIAVTSRHAVHHPTNFSLLDDHGRVRGEYWHSGHLDYLGFCDLDGDGVREILLTGVNNGFQAATLVVLDARDFAGASDQGAGSQFQIGGFPLHKERAVVFFPRTCINEKFERYNMARNITITPEGFIRIGVYERLDADKLVVYTLDRDLNCVDAVAGDQFIADHKRLEGEGLLTHAWTDAELKRLREIRVVRHDRTAPPESPAAVMPPR